MDLTFLPLKIQLYIEQIDVDKLYEIRLRLNYPIILKLQCGIGYLTLNGFSFDSSKALTCEYGFIDEILSNVTENSMYAFNDRLKSGFLTTNDGIRIGIAGECVTDNNKVITVKNITSLNIRIPHFVTGCSNGIFDKICDGKNILNSLIVSTPGFGKTTILKDLAFQVNKLIKKPILIIDERGEFFNVFGENIDIIKYSDKLYAFNYALRSMSPYVVITDELVTLNDWDCVRNANESGVRIIASCHSDSIEKLVMKEYFSKYIFERYFLLECKDSPGILKNVYNGELNII